jgi:hypothetical protein
VAKLSQICFANKEYTPTQTTVQSNGNGVSRANKIDVSAIINDTEAEEQEEERLAVNNNHCNNGRIV